MRADRAANRALSRMDPRDRAFTLAGVDRHRGRKRPGPKRAPCLNCGRLRLTRLPITDPDNVCLRCRRGNH